MKQEVRCGLVVMLSLLAVFCIWKINVLLPEFPDIYWVDSITPAVVTAAPTLEPSAKPQERPLAAHSAEYTMCRIIVGGVSFSQRILDACMPDIIRLKRSIEYVR